MKSGTRQPSAHLTQPVVLDAEHPVMPETFSPRDNIPVEPPANEPSPAQNKAPVAEIPPAPPQEVEEVTGEKRCINLKKAASSSFTISPPDLNQKNGGRPNAVSSTKFRPLIIWLPKSLFYQFQRTANIYFLFIAVITTIGSMGKPPFTSQNEAPLDYSPKALHSKVAPLLFIWFWTALKDLYEDNRRKKDDDKENNTQVSRYDSGKWSSVPWRDVVVGDLVLIPADQSFPADLFVLAAAGGQEVFISTANLDGETNLKERRAPHIFASALEAEGDLKASSSSRNSTAAKVEEVAMKFTENILKDGVDIVLAPPVPAIQDVRATLAFSGKRCPGSEMNFLPRGCILRNTRWIVAVVIYAGADTKARLNMTKVTAKLSNMQKALNTCVLGLVICLFTFCFYATFAALAEADSPKDDEYRDYGAFAYLIIKWCSFMIQFYHVVPISLYVVFEMQKLALGFMINADKAMFYPSQEDPDVEVGAFARTSDLIEEMGQVEFLFSDKTGTLTANEMVFARCSVADWDCGDFRKAKNADGVPEAQKAISDAKHEKHAAMEWYFECLAICHAVQVEEATDPKTQSQTFHYTGASPDEVALVLAAHDVGVCMKSRERQKGSTESIVELGSRGLANYPKKTFSLLYELPFNSDRKRMSVIMRDSNNVHYCITKGADSMIMPLLNNKISKATEDHLHQFSKLGLRTLIVASKKLDLQYFRTWEQKFLAALSTLDKTKDEKVDKVSAEIETSLDYVGVTAVEDRLQDGVPDTIATLKNAGIRIWVLTGDKIETAVDIARSCNLFQESTTLAYATLCSTSQEMIQKLKEAQQALSGKEDTGLVLDGKTVALALESDEARHLIYELGLASRTCLCCRLSPMQKRKLVELVRKESPTTITMSIGDGANDVPMIDGAHVGIGIRGKEGSQAVQASDVAISQFRFLETILLCHGRRGYRRVAFFLCFYLYKNVALAFADIIWTHQDTFAGRIAFAEYISISYNVFFTSVNILPILTYDVDVPDDWSHKRPELYLVGPQRKLFNKGIFTWWMVYAVWHGCIVWLLPNLMYGGQIRQGPSHRTDANDVEMCSVNSKLHGVVCCRTTQDPNYTMCASGVYRAKTAPSASLSCMDYDSAVRHCQLEGASVCTPEQQKLCLSLNDWGAATCAQQGVWLDEADCEVAVEDDPDAQKFWVGSTASFVCLIVVVLMRLWLYSLSPFSRSTLLSIFLPILFLFPCAAFLGYTGLGNSLQKELKGLPFKIFTTDCIVPLVLAPIVAMVPDCIERAIWYFARPTELEQVRKEVSSTK